MLVLPLLALFLTLSFVPATHAAPMPLTFGLGLSQWLLTLNETTLFTHKLSSGATHGAMTQFWATGDTNIDTAIWRYYIDGEAEASFQFQSAQMAGVGFVDQAAPWGTKWIGKGADGGAWYNKFRIPFHRSIRITGQIAAGGQYDNGRLWTMFRGSENLPIAVADYVLPPSARLVQARIEGVTFPRLQFVTLVNVTQQYSGVLWAHFFTAASSTQNFMEGCYHAYTAQYPSFPGLLLSTGTEDYYDSAFYFNAGVFHQENAGLTHWRSNGTRTEVSAYRIHDTDAVWFKGGLRMDWRVGDVSDSKTGLKCTSVDGDVSGDPQATTLTAYTWVYVWPTGDEEAVEQPQPLSAKRHLKVK